MKKKSTSKSAPARRSLGEGGFFNLRVLLASVLCLFAVFVAVLGSGAFAQTKGTRASQQPARSKATQDAPGTQTPDVIRMLSPVRLDQDLRTLPYVAPNPPNPLLPMYRHPRGTAQTSAPSGYGISGLKYVQALLKNIWRAAPNMPGPLFTFEGIGDTCGCQPSDSEGDVGPNNYIEAINESFKIFDKNGNTLSGPTTYNSFFAPLTGTPCGSNQNDGDPFALWDSVADRWIISDFAFPGFPSSGPFYECIAVSQTNDPVSGGWFLYALEVSATDLDDYPKMAVWNNPQPGGAYFFTFNLFNGVTTAFEGVAAFALDRGSMLTGGPANAIGFTVGLTGVGASYSFLASTFRTGDPPPAGRDEFVLAIDSPAAGVTLTQVHGRFFHVDFINPANSTFGMGPNHLPNAEITVNGFIDAAVGANFDTDIVPQQGTSVLLDTVGDRLFVPVVYQNLSGTESLWSSHDNLLNYPNGPVAVRWYQFDVTGGNFPASAVQQQDWSNANDGLWRWMPSIAVDQSGNTVIGYSTSSTTIVPSIRYAGRLASDPPGNLTQGEGIMFAGVSAQTSGNRWGDYTRTDVDPSTGMDFYHINQYAQNGDWHTRIGKFNFVGGGSPTPTPTPAACGWSAGPDLPSAGTRFGGAFFPANGKFYAMGGRDVNNVEFTHPFEFDPVSNTWTTKSASYPDGFVSNTECAVANDSGTDYIYCVGGSQFSTTTSTGRVFRYDPVADVITTVATDWPPGDANVLPGGIAVFNNTIFILGGFNINMSVTDQIWAFTPNPAGWVQKSAVLPEPRAYIPTTTIGNFIYTGGGADWNGTTLVDTTDSFKYDPVADSITTIASIPRATSNTRALNFCNQMYVMGGAFTLISNEVDIYDPGTDTWSIGIPFMTARRNAATDTDGTNNIWLAGGYDSTLTIIASTEIFNCPVSPCAAPSPTPTPTATATATATPPLRSTPTPRPHPTPAPRPTP